MSNVSDFSLVLAFGADRKYFITAILFPIHFIPSLDNYQTNKFTTEKYNRPTILNIRTDDLCQTSYFLSYKYIRSLSGI